MDLNEYLLSYIIIVNLITDQSICKPYDVTILTVIVICSEPILSVMFWFFNVDLWNQIRLNLWNQIR